MLRYWYLYLYCETTFNRTLLNEPVRFRQRFIRSTVTVMMMMMMMMSINNNNNNFTKL